MDIQTKETKRKKEEKEGFEYTLFWGLGRSRYWLPVWGLQV